MVGATSKMTAVFTKEVVLFGATESLLLQISAWGYKHPECVIRLARGHTRAAILAAVEGAFVAIADATEDPGRAIDVVQCAPARRLCPNLAIYTERVHAGLEIIARTRGALLLLGPMSEAEWAGFFAGMLRSAAITRSRPPQPRRGPPGAGGPLD